MHLFTINPTLLREPKAFRVREIGTTELHRCCRPETIKAAEQFNGRVSSHNADVDGLTATVNGLADGKVEGDPVKLFKELGPNRVRLAAAAVSLGEERARLRDSISADFADWRRGARELYDSQKRALSETALAVAGGSTRLADEIMGNSPKLSELRNDAMDWNGPAILTQFNANEQATEDLNAKYALCVAISDASGLRILEHNQTVKIGA